jgi:hypothetical protein
MVIAQHRESYKCGVWRLFFRERRGDKITPKMLWRTNCRNNSLCGWLTAPQSWEIFLFVCAAPINFILYIYFCLATIFESRFRINARRVWIIQFIIVRKARAAQTANINGEKRCNRRLYKILLYVPGDEYNIIISLMCIPIACWCQLPFSGAFHCFYWIYAPCSMGHWEI